MNPAIKFVLLSIPGSVGCAWIGHGVAVVPVGGDLKHQWSLAAAAVVGGELGGFPNSQDVHAVDLTKHNTFQPGSTQHELVS